MILFSSDYCETIHPQILQALSDLGPRQFAGYGEDELCAKAAALIRARIAAPEAAVHFVVGGTQANALVITAALRPHEGVIAAESGHINVHEAGAIESHGHKVLVLPGQEGKLNAAMLENYLRRYYADETFEHQVKPGMIYISQTTELGTVYSRSELEELYAAARRWNLPLYIDGARLGSALTASGQDLQFSDLPRLCDAFSIGGTKNGLAFGEALVLLAPALQKDFRYIQKQEGARLAKGWLLGAQFAAAFQGDLYLEMARHANAMARRLGEGLAEAGVEFAAPLSSNQLFVFLPKAWHESLSASFGYEVQYAAAERVMVRFVSSFQTSPAQVDSLLEAVRRLASGGRNGCREER